MGRLWTFFLISFLVMPAAASAASHYQPGTIPNPDLKMGRGAGSGAYSEAATQGYFGAVGAIGLNLYMNPYLSVNGTVLKGEDACCAGDTLALSNFDLKGEFFSKGGATDSPPAMLVPSLDEVKRQIDAKTFSTATYRFYICYWNVWNDAIGRDEGPNECVVDGTVICESNCSIEKAAGLSPKAGGTYQTTGGSVQMDVSCTPKCIIFVDRKEQKLFNEVVCPYYYRFTPACNITLRRAYGYLELTPGRKTTVIMEGGRSYTRWVFNWTHADPFDPINASFSFGVKNAPEKPKLEATLYKPIKIAVGDEFFIRAVVRNAGGQKAYLKVANLAGGSGKILYMPKELAPGGEDEIIMKATATTEKELTLDLNYEAENLGCLSTKKGTESFSVGNVTQRGKACASDADCSGGKCCAGTCRSGSGVCDDVDGDGVPDRWIAR